CRAYLGLLTLHETGSGEDPGNGWDWDGGGRYHGHDEYAEEDEDYDEDEDEGDENADSGGEYEMVEVFESNLTADHWVDDDGQRVRIGKLDVEPEEVVPEDSLTDVTPEEQFEGYTGNEGMTLNRWYRHAAVFLWPENRHFAILCSRGGRNAIAALDLLVKRWR